jgi:hypothetical protein
MVLLKVRLNAGHLGEQLGVRAAERKPLRKRLGSLAAAEQNWGTA